MWRSSSTCFALHGRMPWSRHCTRGHTPTRSCIIATAVRNTSVFATPTWHKLVAGCAQTMLAELRDADPEGRGLPRHVERELGEYLRCGILAHRFARVRCNTCDDELVVAFSCKRRGICPSCTRRRMADTAAHLVDRVLPEEPYRQWVLSVPKPLRLRLVRDPAWASWVGNLAIRAIAGRLLIDHRARSGWRPELS